MARLHEQILQQKTVIHLMFFSVSCLTENKWSSWRSRVRVKVNVPQLDLDCEVQCTKNAKNMVGPRGQKQKTKCTGVNPTGVVLVHRQVS